MIRFSSAEDEDLQEILTLLTDKVRVILGGWGPDGWNLNPGDPHADASCS